MNNIRGMIYTSFRRYARKANNNPGMRRRVTAFKQHNLPMEFEEGDDDIGQGEADFLSVQKVHKKYENETEFSKRKLVNQIVKTKYFKRTDPNFLTTMEKLEIRSLHQKNPEEWTIERLSYSFPALPHTIKKVLKSKYTPSSVDQAMEYDSKVIDNWKKFKIGKLFVEPDLREHLMKFGNRKVSLSNADMLVKALTPPKVTLPKLQSMFFSNIIQDHLNSKQLEAPQEKPLENTVTISQHSHSSMNSDCNAEFKALTSEEQKKHNIAENTYNNTTEIAVSLHLDKKKSKRDKKVITFDEFMENKLKNINKKSIEDRTLLELHKQRNDEIATQSLEGYDMSVSKEKNSKNKLARSRHDRNEAMTHDSTLNEIGKALENEDNKLDTYVKTWNKNAEEINYMFPIKIPKSKFERGKIYRINDCYYDDDGEFLYRTPGLRN